MEESFPKDEETVPVSTRACARLLAVLKGLGVDPDIPTNPVDAAAFILEGLHESLTRLNAKSRSGASDCPDTPKSVSDDDFFTELTEEELEALDEVTHAAHCRVWNENEETDCNCGAGIQDDGHEYDHGGG